MSIETRMSDGYSLNIVIDSFMKPSIYRYIQSEERCWATWRVGLRTVDVTVVDGALRSLRGCSSGIVNSTPSNGRVGLGCLEPSGRAFKQFGLRLGRAFLAAFRVQPT